MKLDERALQLKAAINASYRPSSPITTLDLFSGRGEQIDNVMNATLQPGQHVILYGERGTGKTSLARIINEVFKKAGLKTLDSGSVNCDASDTFSSIWHKILKELSFNLSKKGLGFQGEEITKKFSLDELLPAEVTPDDVRTVLSQLDKPAIIVLDEIDRIKGKEVRNLLADTIKTLSDHDVKCTVILVGVADSVNQLIDEHKSIDRALVQIPMPRMSAPEILDIINQGINRANMKMTETVKKKIISLSQGLPHYTHLLCHDAAMVAINRDSQVVEDEDLKNAIQKIVGNKHSIHHAYENAILSPQKTSLHPQVLMACALATKEDDSYFSSAAVKEQLSQILGKEVKVTMFARHLNEFCSEKRGLVIQKKGRERAYRYRFSDPLMEPYCLMVGVMKNLIDEGCITKRFELDQLELDLT